MPVQSVLREQYPDIFFFIDRDECGLGYSPKVREFFLRTRPRSDVVQRLSYCPVTGKATPPSLRDRFFEELEALGLEGSLSDVDQAPAEFQSEAWWVARGL